MAAAAAFWNRRLGGRQLLGISGYGVLAWGWAQRFDPRLADRQSGGGMVPCCRELSLQGDDRHQHRLGNDFTKNLAMFPLRFLREQIDTNRQTRSHD